MKKDEQLRNKFALYCKTLIKERDCWNYYHNDKNNDEDTILLGKMDKLIDLLNINEDKYLNMDIENEIYDLL
jgi:hypothetical protein